MFLDKIVIDILYICWKEAIWENLLQKYILEKNI